MREGVTVAEATDVLWTCSSVELYELLVMRRGWSRERFARFLSDLMIAALLPEDTVGKDLNPEPANDRLDRGGDRTEPESFGAPPPVRK